MLAPSILTIENVIEIIVSLRVHVKCILTAPSFNVANICNSTFRYLADDLNKAVVKCHYALHSF